MPVVHVLGKSFEPFILEEEIASRVQEIAAKMNEELAGTQPVFLAVLNGAFFFASDLLKRIDFEYEVSFVKVASYAGMESGKELKTLLGLDESLAGRTVVVIEDIIDTGKTIFELTGQLRNIGVSDIKIATLILKPGAVKFPIAAQYVGFEVPDAFLIGYGLDFNKQGRHYRDIYQVITP